MSEVSNRGTDIHESTRDVGPSQPSPRGWLQRLYDRLHDFADRGWSGVAVFGYGVLQSLIVPGLSDALFLPLALAQPKRAYRLAFAAFCGTIVGATVLFFIGVNALNQLLASYGSWIGVSADGLAQAESLLTRWGWLLIAGSTFSPISTKLLAVSAGAFGMPYVVFISALAISRAVRVTVFAWAIQKYGATVVRETLGLKVDERRAE